MAENPDDVDALMDFDTKANPNRFVGPDGQEITREQLKERFGVSDSQGLRRLQGDEPSFMPEEEKTPREKATDRALSRQWGKFLPEGDEKNLVRSTTSASTT